MTWYTANIVMAIKIIDQLDGELTVYENMVLFEASSMDEAFEKAQKYGAEQILDESMTMNDLPARMSYAGIRKLVAISNPFPLDLDSDAPTTGTEVTYSCFALSDKAALDKFIAGDKVEVTYVE